VAASRVGKGILKPPQPSRDGSQKSGVVLVLALGSADAEIVVAAKIDIVVGRIAVLVEVEILVRQIDVFFLDDFLLLHFLELHRLLGLEHRLRVPAVAALDASDRVILAEVVETSAALRAAVDRRNQDRLANVADSGP